MGDPFERALRDVGAIEALYGPPNAAAVRKDVGLLDEMCARLIAASPMVMIASSSSAVAATSRLAGARRDS